VKYWQPDEAVAEAEQTAPAKPVVLADVADNAGGGSPSDSTFVLDALLRRGFKGALVGLLWDPVAFQIAEEAGEGATLDMRIGGKCGPISGQPIDLRVTVRKLAYACRQSFGPTKNGTGNLAWLQADGIDIVVNTHRTQLFHPDAFEPLGLDPTRYRLIVVKSTQHFYAGFAPLASKVLYVTSRGGIEPDFANIRHSKRTVPYWPRVADPFSGQNA
jgi:microcystin degradation protein MlrC